MLVCLVGFSTLSPVLCLDAPSRAVRFREAHEAPFRSAGLVQDGLALLEHSSSPRAALQPLQRPLWDVLQQHHARRPL